MDDLGNGPVTGRPARLREWNNCAERVVCLFGVVRAIESAAATVIVLDPLGQTRTRVSKLEEDTVGKVGKVDGAGIRHVVEGWVEKNLLRNVKRHTSMYERFRPREGSSDPFDTVMWTLIMVDIRDVANQQT